jgi:methionyl-tRNA formyltransferase
VPTLARLAAEHDVLAVVTQPDRPAGRSQQPTPTPVAQWIVGQRPGVEVLKPADVNDGAIVSRLRSLPADAFVVIAFGQKLGAALLSDRFAINLHASRLPRWRGAAPINHAILAGDAETGNSVIMVASKMDAGEILAQSRRPIDPAMTAGELHDLLSEDGPSLVLDVLARHAAGTLSPRSQDPALVTLAAKLSREDGWIDFAAPAETIRRRVHGLNPWPGVTVRFRDEPLRIHRVECSIESHGPQPEGLRVHSRGQSES